MNKTDIQFNLELLKYMSANVCLKSDNTVYRVFGLNWATDELLLIEHTPVHYSLVDLVQSEGEEEV